jgi:signal transduction histidine kinase
MLVSLKGFKRILNIGIDPSTSAEMCRSIRLVNTLALVTGGSALFLGPMLNYVTGKPIMVPGLIEAFAFFITFVLNSRKKYFEAAMLMLLTQNLSAVYFGILLGQGISIKMLAIGFSITSVFLFHTASSRAIGLSSGFIPIIILNINDYKKFITPWEFTADQHELIKWLADGVIFTICMIIVLSFVQQNQRASENKTTFLRETHHEINKALAAILLTLEKYLKPVAAEVIIKSRDLQVMDVNARKILATVKDGLNFTRIEAGNYDKVHIGLINTEMFVAKLELAFLSLCEELGVKIVKKIDSNIPLWFKTDPNKLDVILTNILSNAIKFSHCNSVVNLNVGYYDGKFIFGVVDYGKGMSKERQETLFDGGLFVSEHNELVQGYGIGMVMTRRYMDLLGGAISVESQEGHGTTIVVTLPVAIPVEEEIKAKTTEASKGARGERPDLSGKRVLIIEDDEMMLHNAIRILTDYGCRVILTAQRVETGIELAKRECPDFILLDVQLPDGSGLDVLKALQKHKLLKNIPVLSLSSEESDILIRQLQKEGGALFLKKPYSLSDFQKRIIEILNITVKP